MAVHFVGFPRALSIKALRPGRWFVPAGPNAHLCLMTGLDEGVSTTVLSFSLGRVDTVEFCPRSLSSLSEPFQSVEDDVVFSPGTGEAPRLFPAYQGPYPSGALLRLTGGDIGIGFAERLHAKVTIVSLTSGLPAEGVDLVFERWSMFLRRGSADTLLGRFHPDIRTWRPTKVSAE